MCEQFAQRNSVHFELTYTPFGLRLHQAKTNNFCRIVRTLHKFSIDNIIICGACASNSTLNTLFAKDTREGPPYPELIVWVQYLPSETKAENTSKETCVK